MRSSISSSDAVLAPAGAAVTGSALADGTLASGVAVAFEGPGLVRQTASDRPGVAQPVPVRDIPVQPWGRILLATVLMTTVLVGAWERYWRTEGATPAYRNSNGAWAEQRRRIDTGEGYKTVLVGSSRVLFDIQLPVWERVTGRHPIQLAMEGTSPLPILEDLAADPKFTGRVVVGVAPELFFSGYTLHDDLVPYYHSEGPSRRIGHWLSRQLVEPVFAFDDPDFALGTVVRRAPWPARAGLPPRRDVRKLSTMQDADRNTHMWRKVENDPRYRALVRSIWVEHLSRPPPPPMNTPAKLQSVIDAQIGRAVAAVAKLRARGVQVLFLRPPSIGPYYAMEQKVFPRARTWDVLLRRTGAPGIHFEDYPQLQGYDQPEWSHLSASEAQRFTAALATIVQRDYWPAPRPLVDNTSAAGLNHASR